jgi:hypothetical protein
VNDFYTTIFIETYGRKTLYCFSKIKQGCLMSPLNLSDPQTGLINPDFKEQLATVKPKFTPIFKYFAAHHILNVCEELGKGLPKEINCEDARRFLKNSQDESLRSSSDSLSDEEVIASASSHWNELAKKVHREMESYWEAKEYSNK